MQGVLQRKTHHHLSIFQQLKEKARRQIINIFTLVIKLIIHRIRFAISNHFLPLNVLNVRFNCEFAWFFFAILWEITQEFFNSSFPFIGVVSCHTENGMWLCCSMLHQFDHQSRCKVEILEHFDWLFWKKLPVGVSLDSTSSKLKNASVQHVFNEMLSSVNFEAHDETLRHLKRDP